MAYSRTWNPATPPATAAANTIDQLIRNAKVDLAERIMSLLGIPDFTVDPLKGVSLNMGGSAATKIIPGTASLSVRNNADTQDNLLVADNGSVTVRNKLLILSAISGNLNVDPGFQIIFNSQLKMQAAQAYIAPASAIIAAASQSIDWNTSNNQQLQLANNTTLSFSNAGAGGWYFMSIKQTGAGNWTITWPASVKWASDTAPTLTATSGKTDYVSFYYNGTNYVGFLVGQNYNV